MSITSDFSAVYIAFRNIIEKQMKMYGGDAPQRDPDYKFLKRN